MVVTELHLPPRVVMLRARRQQYGDRRRALQAVLDEEAAALAIEDQAKDEAIRREQLRNQTAVLRLQQKLAEVRSRSAASSQFLGPPALAGVLTSGALGSWVYFADNPVSSHYGSMLGLAIPTALLIALSIIGPWLILSLAPFLARKRDEELTLRQIEQLEDRKMALALGEFAFDCYEHPSGEEYFKISYDLSPS